MSKYYSYLNTSKSIIEAYDGSFPLAGHLKQHFRTSSKFGSKDRKAITTICFNYFRLANTIATKNLEEAIIDTNFLMNNIHFIENVKPELYSKINDTLEEKIHHINPNFNLNNVFPFSNYLSENIENELFNLSFINQPSVFIRIRPGQSYSVIQKIIEAELPYKQITETCISFENSTKIDQLLNIGDEVIIQDYSSQKCGEIMRKYIENMAPNTAIWDCCAASGGKSIMMHDINSAISLTVSDIRPSILSNLSERFALAGIKKYVSFVANLSVSNLDTTQKFKLIIADVPCTGSGTWARTPEEKHFFKSEKIDEFAQLQYNIVKNTVDNLENNGIYIYITCSVFADENENQVKKIAETLPLKLIEMETLKGYTQKADSMFIAIFQKYGSKST